VTTRLLIVDDHPLFRSGLALTLTTALGFEIVEVGSAHEAIELAARTAFDLALVDVLMPITSGVALCHDLHELQPDCKVLMLSGIDDPEVIADLLRVPSSGFAIKTQSVPELVDAIHQVLGGLRYIPPTFAHGALDVVAEGSAERRFATLSRREREIFELLVDGYTNDDIAKRLFISRRTVESHRQRVMNKLSAHTLAALQRIFTRLGRIRR